MVKDPITEVRLSQLYPPVAEAWRRVDAEIFFLHGRRLRLISGIRTRAEQWANWAKGREKQEDGTWKIVNPKLVVTYARPGESYHEWGLGVDTGWLSVEDEQLDSSDPYLKKLIPKQAHFLWSELAKAYENEGFEAGFNWSYPKTDMCHGQMSFGMEPLQLRRLFSIGGCPLVWRSIDEQRVKYPGGLVI